MFVSKKFLGAASVFVSLAVLLSGCSGSGSSEATGEVGGSIDYSFWGSPARAAKVGTVIDLFSAQHPGVKVGTDVADYTAYVERLTVRAAGNGLACVIGSQSTFAAPYAQEGVLRPLDDLVADGSIAVEGFSDDVLAAGKIDGKQYIVPTGVFVRLLGYNEEMVAASGAPAPSDDLTWEQYGEWLRSVQAGLPQGKYASELEAVNMFSFTSWVIGHGQKMFDGENLAFDKQLMVDWFTFWSDLTADGATVPPSMIADQFGALELAPMATGIAASATRDIPHLYINEQVLKGAGQDTRVLQVDIPSEQSDQTANVIGINGVSIPNSCENVSTAAAFADFFANDADAALAFQSDNGVVANAKGQDALLADAATPAGVKQNVTILRDLTDADDLTTTTYPASLSSLTSELRRTYEDVAFGRASVEDAVDAFFQAAK